MIPETKEDGLNYWELILCYIENVLTIIHYPKSIMHVIQPKFNLKDD